MKQAMKIMDYVWLAVAGLLVTVYKLFSKDSDKILPKNVVSVTILSLLVSVFAIPAVMEHFALSVRIGLGLSVVCNLFIDIVMNKIGQKLSEKIDKL